LLHITSLPSPYGIGDLGHDAYRFADFLAEAAQSVWQILPLNPTSALSGNSPYSSSSAFAGNPLLISLDRLLEEGFLVPADLENPPLFDDGKLDYEAASSYKWSLLRRAFEQSARGNLEDGGFVGFCRENAYWLEDHAFFVAFREHSDGFAWRDWPEDIRQRTEKALNEWRRELADKILAEKFFQYVFFRQWSKFKNYCNQKNIQIIGDLPIYVSYDSVDVWANPEVFQLDEDLRPAFVAGVPPDYFSSTGQHWGNPLYRWDMLEKTGFGWWIQRLGHNLRLFDAIRLDHFRGFVGYWAIPGSETTAVNGKWEPAPAWDFFSTLFKRFPYLPIIAEDLGVITPEVREVIAGFGFPGMKVLQFAFSEDLPTNANAPHNHIRNAVVYTGTHDNNTTRGWFRIELDARGKERLFGYLGRKVEASEVHWELIRLAMMSVCETAITPMQDVLGLGEEARMNLPAVARGNWEWRLHPDLLTTGLAQKLAGMTRLCGRA